VFTARYIQRPHIKWVRLVFKGLSFRHTNILKMIIRLSVGITADPRFQFSVRKWKVNLHFTSGRDSVVKFIHLASDNNFLSHLIARANFSLASVNLNVKRGNLIRKSCFQFLEQLKKSQIKFVRF
jgi:hypothetical protein